LKAEDGMHSEYGGKLHARYRPEQAVCNNGSSTLVVLLCGIAIIALVAIAAYVILL
jgi:hypothetical protein